MIDEQHDQAVEEGWAKFLKTAHLMAKSGDELAIKVLTFLATDPDAAMTFFVGGYMAGVKHPLFEAVKRADQSAEH